MDGLRRLSNSRRLWAKAHEHRNPRQGTGTFPSQRQGFKYNGLWCNVLTGTNLFDEEGSMFQVQEARTPGQRLPTRRDYIGEEMDPKGHLRNNSGNDERRTSGTHDFASRWRTIREGDLNLRRSLPSSYLFTLMIILWPFLLWSRVKCKVKKNPSNNA